MRNIVFYRAESGASPIEDFLDSLPGKQAQRVAWVLRLIEEIDSVPAQYFKKLPGTVDIWEVRVQAGNDTIRLLGFLFGPSLVLTNGFAKKTRKAPPREIALAEQRRREYLHRSRKK